MRITSKTFDIVGSFLI